MEPSNSAATPPKSQKRKLADIDLDDDKEFDEALKQQQKRNAAVNALRQDLTSKFHEAQAELTSLTKTVSKPSTKLVEIKRALDKVNQAYEALEEKIKLDGDAHSEHLKELQAKAADIQAAHMKTRQQSDKNMNDVLTCDQSLSRLSEIVQNIDPAVKNLMSKATTLSSNVDSHTKDIAKAHSDHEILSGQVGTIKPSAEEHDRSLKKLRTDHDEFVDVVKLGCQKLSGKADEAEKRIANMEPVLESLTAYKESSTTEITALRTTVHELQRDARSFAERMTNVENKVDDNATTLQQLSDTVDDTIKQVDQVLVTIQENYKGTVRRLKDKNETALEKQREEFQGELQKQSAQTHRAIQDMTLSVESTLKGFDLGVKASPSSRDPFATPSNANHESHSSPQP